MYEDSDLNHCFCHVIICRLIVVMMFVFWQLKHMKELEQEKDSLLAGLDVLDHAREWYQTQIHNVIETQRHVGQSNSIVSSPARSSCFF